MKDSNNKITSKKADNNEKDLDLDFALKTLGYLLPCTEKEINAFNEINGNTEIDLPDHFKNPDFLKNKVTVNIRPDHSTADKKARLNKSNDYFNKTVLAAEIAYQLHNEPTFGHIKFVKIFCLCTEVCNMKLTTNYEKYAAGPLDPKLMYSIDAELKKQKWFKKVKRDSYGFKYVPLENVEKYKDYYLKRFANQLESIERIINLFRKMDSPFCEKVATLYFVWKEAIANRTIINEQVLFKGFYSWDESKKRFKEDELTKALVWMKENNIVPIK